MGNGLKEQWGVDDPAQAGSDQQAQEFQAAFQPQLTTINEHLQYTAVNAEAAKNDPLAARRDALYQAFQSALGQIDPADPAKAQGAIDKVLADAQALSTEVASFRADAEKAFNDWQSQQAQFDETVRQVEEMEAWEHPKAGPLRGLVDGIRDNLNQRRYAQACTVLGQLLPKSQPIYEEYLKQKAAQEQYEPAVGALQGRLDAAAQGQHAKLAPMQQEIDGVKTQMESAAQSKDFVTALQQMNDLSAKVDAYEGAVAESEQKKKEYEDALAALQPKLDEVSQSQSPKLAPMRDEITALQGQMQTAAQNEDYDQAMSLLQNVSGKVDTFAAAVAEQEQKKKEYEDALAALQPKLDEVSQSQSPKLGPMRDEIAAVQKQIETVAQSEDYDQALTMVKDLSAKVDAFAAAKAEEDQKKKEYEDALAALQPELAEASKSQYPKLATLQEEMAAEQQQMETAAQNEDYDQALSLVKDLSAKVDAYKAAKAEIETNKSAFEDALKPVTPKLDDVAQGSYPGLTERQAEIAKLRQDMEAAAQSGDFDKALQLLQDITPKAEAYLSDKAKAKAYQDALQAVQTALGELNAHAQKKFFGPEIGDITNKLKDAQAKGDGGDWENATKLLKQLQSQCSKTKITMDMVAKGLAKARAEEVADVTQSLVDSGVDPQKAIEVGQVMHVGGSGTTADEKVVAKEVAKLPTDAIKAMNANGTKVVACRGSVTDYKPSLKGGQPRDWKAGSAWDTVPGVHSGGSKEVIIATRGTGTPAGPSVPATGNGHGSYDLTVHESMHGVDLDGKGTAKHADPAFQAARTADLAKLGSYFTQAGEAGLEETYAESAARYYGHDPKMKTDWPNLYKYWDSQPK